MFQDSLLQKALGPFAAQRLGLVLEKQTMLQSLNPIFSILFTLLIERQINEFEDTDENELGSRTRNPVKRAGGLAVCFHGAFNPDHNPLFPAEFPPSAGVTHSSANALCL